MLAKPLAGSMAESTDQGSGERVCPYLRGRYQGDPALTPSLSNHCVLAASIHLPTAQQSRYCLGGQHPTCSRFLRQQARPLPRYVTGIPAPLPAILPPRPDLPTLWWRRPWGRIAIRLLLALVLVGMIVLGWRWRSASIPARFSSRPQLPTPIVAVTPTPINPYLPPRLGPPSR